MNPAQTHPQEKADRNPSLQLEWFLAYEDGPTAERAKHAVETVLSMPEVNIQPHLHLWRLDVLSDPKLSEPAAREATAADIVVVAIHGRSRIPAQSETRLKQWIGDKPAKPRALVISLDSEAKPQAVTNSTLAELRAAATRNGVTVLLHFGEPARRASGARPAGFASRAAATSQPPDPHPHWGINE